MKNIGTYIFVASMILFPAAVFGLSEGATDDIAVGDTPETVTGLRTGQTYPGGTVTFVDEGGRYIVIDKGDGTLGFATCPCGFGGGPADGGGPIPEPGPGPGDGSGPGPGNGGGGSNPVQGCVRNTVSAWWRCIDLIDIGDRVTPPGNGDGDGGGNDGGGNGDGGTRTRPDLKYEEF